MQNLIFQAQLLLAALAAFLPIMPTKIRAAAAGVLETIGLALTLGEGAIAHLEELTTKLSAVRADIEAMAAADRPPGAEELEAACDRVLKASSAFRAAVA